MGQEWCPKCQKYVRVWMKANQRKEGDLIITIKDYFCYDCRQFLKNETGKQSLKPK